MSEDSSEENIDENSCHFNFGIPHYLNYSDQGSAQIFKEAKMFFVDFPYSVTDPEVLPEFDSYDKLIEEKLEYDKQFTFLRKEYSRLKGNLVAVKLDNIFEVPQLIVDLAKDNITDPDPFFPSNCNYNWYYTGGCLDCIITQSDTHLFHPNRYGGIDVRNFEQINDKYSINLKMKSPIFSLNSHVINNDIFITTRQKNKLTIICTDVDNIRKDKSILVKRRSLIPFVDAKLNEFSTVHFCTMNAEKHVEICDTNTNKVLNELSLKNGTTSDEFGQLDFFSENLLMIMDRNSLILTDQRFGALRKTNLCLSPCDDLCLFKTSDSKYVYVSSKHNFLKVDIRTFKIVYKYPHMMQTPPYLMTLEKNEDCDMICLSCRSSKVLLQDVSGCHSLPFEIPNITDTFKEMQLTEKFEDYEDYEERLNLSTLGMQIVKPSKGECYLLSLNSAGDIFTQKIYQDYSDSNATREFATWIEKVPKQETVLKFNSLIEQSEARFSLNNYLNKGKRPAQNKVLERLEAVETPVENFFGKRLEAIWLVKEPDAVTAEETLGPPVHPKTKVSAWLQSQEFSDSAEGENTEAPLEIIDVLSFNL